MGKENQESDVGGEQKLDLECSEQCFFFNGIYCSQQAQQCTEFSPSCTSLTFSKIHINSRRKKK